jgi:hypothetical protein
LFLDAGDLVAKIYTPGFDLAHALHRRLHADLLEQRQEREALAC